MTSTGSYSDKFPIGVMSAIDSQDWQSGRSLSESCDHMLTNEIACDLRFLVGESKTPVKAHKFIMICRSSVFQAMLCGDFADGKSDIEIPDIDTDTFRTILRFLYTDKACVTGNNALAVLYASKKYAITQLVNKCLSILTDGQTLDNVCSILEQAHFYSEEVFMAKSLDFIFDHGYDVLMTSGFLELCRDCVIRVISSDNLKCEERTVLDAVTKWAERQCAKNEKVPSPEVLRETLGDILYLVRFPIMGKDYFTNVVSDSLLLTDTEKVELFKYFYRANSSNDCKLFITRERACLGAMCDIGVNGHENDVSIQTCIRFKDVDEDEGWGCDPNVPDSIGFQTNDNIFLHGILVYGSYIGQGRYGLTTVVLDGSDNELLRHSSVIKTSETQQTYAVLFDCPLTIPKNKSHVIAVAFDSYVDTYRGEGGTAKCIVGDNGLCFTFSKSRRSRNGTNVNVGQIPGILFSTDPLSEKKK